VSEYLSDLSASDYPAATLKSYAYGLCGWFGFLDSSGVAWQEAGRGHVREYVLHLRSAENPYRRRRGSRGPAAGSVNPKTGKPYLSEGYKASTINHRLSVVKGFYEFHRLRGAGPPANPVPSAQPSARPNAHRTPDDPWMPKRRAPYRQKEPESFPRGIADELWAEAFGALTSDRDRAILCLLVSSGARAGELLKMTPNDVDWGRQCVRLVTKGTGVGEWVAASPDFFRWLARYLAGRDAIPPDGPLWRKLRKPHGPLNYQALRKVLVRVNARIGANLVLHDFRHTCALALASDPEVPLTDVQAHLRHKHLSTTERYLRPRPEDVIRRVRQHQSEQQRDGVAGRDGAAAGGGWVYDPDDLDALLGGGGVGG
jgi:integrase